MILVIDANILFSALITPNGKLAKILTHPRLPVTRISCHFVVVEILKHRAKIVRFSKKQAENITEDLYYYLKHIRLFEESFIAAPHWKEAERLTSGIDCFDVNYVALALQTGAWLWTGDKKLTTHLKSMGFDRVVNTAELYEQLDLD
ncbi:MAG: PIN domain-containing protein [Bacteroidota bacterium]|nr:PIN domain-containing protein [Bacteroidota bacterium]